jgi:hypothetical protein
VTAEDVYDSSSGAYPGVTIKYKGHKDYFNFPTARYNGTSAGDSSYDTFGYNAVVSTLVTAKSLAATQSVKVINVNDLTAVSGPAEPQLVYALSQAEKTEKDKFCEDEENQNMIECTTSDIAKLTNIFFDEVSARRMGGVGEKRLRAVNTPARSSEERSDELKRTRALEKTTDNGDLLRSARR